MEANNPKEMNPMEHGKGCGAGRCPGPWVTHFLCWPVGLPSPGRHCQSRVPPRERVPVPPGLRGHPAPTVPTFPLFQENLASGEETGWVARPQPGCGQRCPGLALHPRLGQGDEGHFVVRASAACRSELRPQGYPSSAAPWLGGPGQARVPFKASASASITWE